MTDIEMNSKEYWNSRFQTDWDEKLGREQSRYFANLAIEYLPTWFSQIVRSQKLSICDWGCAEGDGTDILSGLYGADLVSGVDFSEDAIINAKAAYPHIRFSVQNWVTDDAPDLSYDIVFSSNTLEHFHEPSIILQNLLPVARKCVVLLLPFRECERHSEHHHTFLASNIAVSPSNEYVLAHSQVIESGARIPSYWPGQQILLIYIRPEFSKEIGLMLADIIISDEKDLEIKSIFDAKETISQNLINELEHSSELSKAEIHKLERKLKIEKQNVLDNYRELAVCQKRYCEISEISEIQQNEIIKLNTDLLQIKKSRGWKYMNKMHRLRHKLLPAGSFQYKSARLLYKSGTFLTSCARIATPQKIKQFINHSRRHGVKDAIVKTRAFISRVDAYQNITNLASHVFDIYENQGTKELLGCLQQNSYRGVFVMGSCCMGWHEVFKQRHHHIADFLMDQGYLVICAMNPDYPEDRTDCIKRDSENLFLVNFEDRGIWRQVIELLAKESLAPLYYHLVGTEPGTTIENIEELKDIGYLLVYDYLDEISKEINPALSDFCLNRHEYILRDEDILLVASADNLYNKASSYRSKNVICSPNGVKLEDWILEKDAPIPPEIANIVAEGKPIVGYYGSFATWMNYDFIKALSTRRPDINIVMIGYDYDWGKGAFTNSNIANLPNVHILPAQNYYNLKYFSRFFDAGIVPFREYELTKSVSPVKMFEYMAQGIPVVASGMEECRKYESCLNADNEDDFVKKVGQALLLKKDASYMKKLKNDAKDNTWKERCKVIEDAMSDLTKQTGEKLLTIVIPTYNMEQLLSRCVDSMIPPSQMDQLEIIIVNDGSKDNSLNLARDYETRFPKTIRVIDKENGGHGSCINVGMRTATGKYFKIVDADDWLDPLDLTKHLTFLNKNDADMIVTNYLRTYDDGRGELVSYNDRLQQNKYASDEFYRSLMVDSSSTSYAHMHAITYNSAILKDNNITITEKAFYVDQEYIAYPQKYISNVMFENITLYRYYIGRPGQSIDPIVARKRAPNNYQILQNIIETYKLMPEKSEGSRYILNIAFHHSWFYLDNSDNHEIKIELMQWWRSNDWHFYNILNKNFSIV